MNPRLLDFVVCPICATDLALDAETDSDDHVNFGTVSCVSGHMFPIVDGVPRLLPEAAVTTDDARSIQQSFSREWEHFDYERDRAWGLTSKYRLDAFLEQLEVSPDDFAGKVVLDAGCGVGVLSAAISNLGCEVIAGDIGHQVVGAHSHFTAEGVDRVQFLQANLMEPPVSSEVL